MPLISKTIQTSHADISVLETNGRGLPLVFLHGSGFSKSVFATQFDSPLADHFRLIAIDLPGHGMSGDAHNPKESYTLSGFADAVAQVLVQRQVEQAVVFGWSLGGQIAIELLNHTDRIAGLALSGAVPNGKGVLAMFKGAKVSRAALLATRARMTEKGAEKFVDFVFSHASGKAFKKDQLRADPRFRPILARSFLQHDQRASIEGTDIPIAMINGSDDPIVRHAYLAGLRYRDLWGEMVHMLPDAGHAAFWDRPEMFNEMLGRFLNEVAARDVVEAPRRVIGSA